MRRLARYLGRRGGFLVLFGVAWVLCGVSFATVPVERFSAPHNAGPLVFMDTRPWPGLLWIVCGLVALVNGLIRRRVGNEDAAGYAALVIPAMLWAVCFAWSFGTWAVWRIFDGTPPPLGRTSAGLGVVVYAVLVVAVLVVANWKDDLDLPASRDATGPSAELALNDLIIETHAENAVRGAAARAENERFIGRSRLASERNIAESRDENDRRIANETEPDPPDVEA